LKPGLTQHLKIHSKWSKDLSIEFETINLAGECVWANFHDIGFVYYFIIIESIDKKIKDK
jgi:hypothetical protein